MSLQKIPAAIILAVAATVVVAGVLAPTLLMSSQRIPSNGSVNVKAVNVGVYSDSDCTRNVTSIDWGSREPGDVISRTLYVKNSGNVPAILSMTTENWLPSGANGSISLSWNRSAYVLQADDEVSATLTLTISSDIEGIESFSFDIVITGTEQQ